MAFGSGIFQNVGGAVSDLMSGDAAQKRGYIKARGDWVEAANYKDAAALARQNADFTKSSTAIKDTMAERQIYKTISGQQADIAGAGFQESGSAIDLMRASAAEGALTRQLLGEQGLITEAGHRQQATSYDRMAEYATWAGNQEHELGDQAKRNSGWTAGLKIGAAAFSLGTAGMGGMDFGDWFGGGSNQSNLDMMPEDV